MIYKLLYLSGGCLYVGRRNNAKNTLDEKLPVFLLSVMGVEIRPSSEVVKF